VRLQPVEGSGSDSPECGLGDKNKVLAKGREALTVPSGCPNLVTWSGRSRGCRRWRRREGPTRQRGRGPVIRDSYPRAPSGRLNPPFRPLAAARPAGAFILSGLLFDKEGC
jgi:hypothetical protein